MPPKGKKSSGPWWENRTAYDNHPDIVVKYEYQHGKDLILPGAKIRIKNQRGTYKFRCWARNTDLEVEWIDCMEEINGAWCSYRPDKLKGLVKPKRPRKRKVVDEKV